MDSRLPQPLQELVDQLGKLPGLGPKSALRIAMVLLKWPETETRRLGQGIYSLRDNLNLCSRCGGLTATSPCPLCADETRDRSILCLVPEWDSLLAMEAGAFYHGQYLILGGLLTPLMNQDSTSLELERLVSRLAEGEIKELVLALGATMEAENTAAFITQLLKKKFPTLRISRLAQGIPLGSEVKYMDGETLRQSLRFRQEL